MSIERMGILCGVFGPLLWLSLIAVAGAIRPEYSHSLQYISELGERGGVTEFMMRYAAFGFSGILYLCFSAALVSIFQGNWVAILSGLLIGLDGIGRIGAGVFPCDLGCEGPSWSQEMHKLFATVGFLSAVVAAVFWGVALKQYRSLQRYSTYFVWSGILGLAFLLLMSWEENPVHAPGLFEHLATGVLSLWVMVFAVALIRSPEPHPVRTSYREGGNG